MRLSLWFLYQCIVSNEGDTGCLINLKQCVAPVGNAITQFAARGDLQMWTVRCHWNDPNEEHEENHEVMNEVAVGSRK